mmetsp:Transcript_19605/g.53861  ORF Transcript_19605/g.53861 Transcript_19605/m.53861 type:complete len:217 (-) Transcript_19605:27-677(-)
MDGARINLAGRHTNVNIAISGVSNTNQCRTPWMHTTKTASCQFGVVAQLTFKTPRMKQFMASTSQTTKNSLARSKVRDILGSSSCSSFSDPPNSDGSGLLKRQEACSKLCRKIKLIMAAAGKLCNKCTTLLKSPKRLLGRQSTICMGIPQGLNTGAAMLTKCLTAAALFRPPCGDVPWRTKSSTCKSCLSHRWDSSSPLAQSSGSQKWCAGISAVH